MPRAVSVAKLSENRLNVKLRSLGKSMVDSRKLKGMDLMRCEDKQSITRASDVFECIEGGFRLQLSGSQRQQEITAIIEPEQPRFRHNDNAGRDYAESLGIVEVFTDRPDKMTEVVEFQKPIRFKDVDVIIRTNKNFFRLTEPRALIVNVTE